MRKVQIKHDTHITSVHCSFCERVSKTAVRRGAKKVGRVDEMGIYYVWTQDDEIQFGGAEAFIADTPREAANKYADSMLDDLAGETVCFFVQQACSREGSPREEVVLDFPESEGRDG